MGRVTADSGLLRSVGGGARARDRSDDGELTGDEEPADVRASVSARPRPSRPRAVELRDGSRTRALGSRARRRSAPPSSRSLARRTPPAKGRPVIRLDSCRRTSSAISPPRVHVADDAAVRGLRPPGLPIDLAEGDLPAPRHSDVNAFDARRDLSVKVGVVGAEPTISARLSLLATRRGARIRHRLAELTSVMLRLMPLYLRVLPHSRGLPETREGA
jgi:hypothetical protein